MANRRTPLAKAKAMGRDVHDRARFDGRNEPVSTALGAPSDFLGEHEREAWESFRSEFPWLMESDRALVEIACSLRARLFAGKEVGVNALAQLRICLSAMGGTPTDRTRVSMPSDAEPDPADKFFN